MWSKTCRLHFPFFQQIWCCLGKRRRWMKIIEWCGMSWRTAKTKTFGKLAIVLHSGSMKLRLTQKTTVLMSSERMELARSGDRKLRSPALRDRSVADGAPRIRMMWFDKLYSRTDSASWQSHKRCHGRPDVHARPSLPWSPSMNSLFCPIVAVSHENKR